MKVFGVSWDIRCLSGCTFPPTIFNSDTSNKGKHMYTQFLKPVSNFVFSARPHVTKSNALTALFPHTCQNYFCFRVPRAQQKNIRERNHQQNNLRSLVLNPRRTNHRQWSPRRVAMHCSSNALNQTQLLHVQKSILRRTARKDMMRVNPPLGSQKIARYGPLNFLCVHARANHPPWHSQPVAIQGIIQTQRHEWFWCQCGQLREGQQRPVTRLSGQITCSNIDPLRPAFQLGARIHVMRQQWWPISSANVDIMIYVYIDIYNI